jgi:hypothetical protein
MPQALLRTAAAAAVAAADCLFRTNIVGPVVPHPVLAAEGNSLMMVVVLVAL